MKPVALLVVLLAGCASRPCVCDGVIRERIDPPASGLVQFPVALGELIERATTMDMDEVEALVGPPKEKGKTVDRRVLQETPDNYYVTNVSFSDRGSRRSISIQLAGGMVGPCFDLEPGALEARGFKEVHMIDDYSARKRFSRSTLALDIYLRSFPGYTGCMEYLEFRERR